jgi:hypothetical protein
MRASFGTLSRMKIDERRVAVRHVACVPADVELDGEAEPTTALIAEISVSGALLFTCGKWEVGDTLRLSLQLSGDAAAEPQAVAGKVVRVAPRGLECSDLWGYTAAVQFDTPVTTMAGAIEAHGAAKKPRLR